MSKIALDARLVKPFTCYSDGCVGVFLYIATLMVHAHTQMHAWLLTAAGVLL